jgi:hypothetical protein
MDPPKPRDFWDKLDIVLKGLLPVAVAAVGYFGTSYLSGQQRAESTRQFYTSLQAQRETADGNLRKEMFSYVIGNFLGKVEGDPQKRVVGLEMLALNFHESFDLLPLFEDTYLAVVAQVPNPEESARLVKRLVELSREINDRQIAALADVNHQWRRVVDLRAGVPGGGTGPLPAIELRPLEHPAGSPALGTAGAGAGNAALDLRLSVTAIDRRHRRVQVSLEVWDRVKSMIVERSFWVSPFDFPALHNIRLPNRERLALVLNAFEDDHVDMTVLHFPEGRASLKEKPYIDDLIADIGRTDQRRAPR